MRISNKLNKALFLALLLAVAGAAVAKQPKELMWDEMIPVKETPATPPDPLAPGGDPQPQAQLWGNLDFMNPVQALDGEYVKLPGFVVPLESDEGGLLTEFLLVPYFGACIHTPPPPPNQIVYVTFEEPVDVRQIMEPYWIIGEMSTKTYVGDIADAVYQIAGEDIEVFEY